MAGKFLRSARALKDHMRHTCTVQRATLSTTADPYHPGSSNRVVDWTTIAASSTGIRCSLQRLATAERATMGEVATGGKAGTTIATHYLMMAVADAPSTLLDADSAPAPETFHRIANVLIDGVLYDAGPFDIEAPVDMAGDGMLLKLELKRVN